MADKSNLKDWLIIAAVFGPDKALTIYSVVVWDPLSRSCSRSADAFEKVLSDDYPRL